MATTVRSEMKSIIDQGHFGLENLKKRARQALFWPPISGVIEDTIKKLSNMSDFS